MHCAPTRLSKHAKLAEAMAHHGAVGLTSDPAQVSDGSVPESLSAEKSIVATHAIIQSDKKSSILIKSQDFTSQILAFLSTADNDTLGACLAGLVAITYLVLGRVGLVLIGVVVGIVLHAGWEEPINASGRAQMVLQGTRKKNNEQSFALLERVLDWRELKTNHSGFEENDVPKQSLSTASSVNLDFSDFPPSTGTALNNLADAVIRDYIKYENQRLLQTLTLIKVGGGMILSCRGNLPFQLHAEGPSQSSLLLSLRIFHGKGQQTHS